MAARISVLLVSLLLVRDRLDVAMRVGSLHVADVVPTLPLEPALNVYLDKNHAKLQLRYACVVDTRSRNCGTQTGVVQAQLAENQRLQAALEKATDQIHELIDKNEKIALALTDTRAGAEVKTQAAAKLTAQVASTRSTLQTARIIDKTGKVTASVKTTTSE